MFFMFSCFHVLDLWNEIEWSQEIEIETENVIGIDTEDHTVDPDPGNVIDLNIEQSQNLQQMSDQLSQVVFYMKNILHYIIYKYHLFKLVNIKSLINITWEIYTSMIHIYF